MMLRRVGALASLGGLILVSGPRLKARLTGALENADLDGLRGELRGRFGEGISSMTARVRESDPVGLAMTQAGRALARASGVADSRLRQLEVERMVRRQLGIERASRARWSRAAFLGGAAIGAGLIYLMDPQSGRRRRALLADRSGAVMRAAARNGERLQRLTTAELYGLRERIERGGPGDAVDDVALADRVRSEVLSKPGVPKGEINISVENGVVVLRGAAARPQITMLELLVRRVSGVHDVRNLLHEPGTTAPNKQEAERAGG